MINYIKGSGGCFPAGSKVATPNGYKDIDKLSIGDLVLSFDYTGRIATSKVVEVHTHENKDVYEYSYWGGTITATPNHWVLNQYNAFSEIGNLTTEDSLVDINNHLRPLIGSKFVNTTTVYNLTVEDDHTYILEGIRVHNGGGGKGGGSAHVPVEDPDSLRSIEYAKVVDLISEGEIGGLINGLKSVYLDDTPIQNADNSLNFTGVELKTVGGTQDQTSIVGFTGASAETAVSVEIRSSANTKAIFTGTVSGTTLTVTAMTSGTITLNSHVTSNNLPNWTYITAFGTGTGGTGTYILNNSKTISTAETFTSENLDALFTGYIVGTVLTVTAMDAGSLSVGKRLFGSTILDNTYIDSLGTGTGGTGTYNIKCTSKYTTTASATINAKDTGSVTRTITNPNLDAVRVTLGIPQLTYQEPSTGDIHGSEINVSIELSTDNGTTYQPQPITQIDYGSVLTTDTSTGITSCSKPSSYFKILVHWDSIHNPVYSSSIFGMSYVTGNNPLQHHETTLQYRIVGSSTWTSFGNAIFSGKTEVVVNPSSYGGMGYLGNPLASYSSTTKYASGSQTFNLILPENLYEFRLLNTVTSGTTTIDLTNSTARIARYYDIISGKTISKYQRSYRINVPSATVVTATGVTSSGTTLNMASTTGLQSGMVLSMVSGIGTFNGSTVITYVGTSYVTVNTAPSVALSGATIKGTSGGVYTLRVNKNTVDSTNSNLINHIWWDSYTEILDDKLSYPNSALMAISVDASQFNRIPTRAYDIYGIKVKIPSNYNPFTRVYTGIWDGTFTVNWTDNPAWIFYDLITNKRYGLGDYLQEAMLDKWNLYSIAQYCDEFVPDGLTDSGYEPRFTCNLYLQTSEDAYKVVNNLASIFRAITYWNNGTLMLSQDKPSDPIGLFTTSNVIDGSFTYQGSSLKTRHNAVQVTWNDPADNYKTKIEYVEDLEGIQRSGAVLSTQIAAMGCTSRGQAHRIGKWLLYTERYESETVSFKTGLDSTIVYPGAIIQTYDAFRTGKRFGGRIVSATTNIITIDNPVTLISGYTYKLSCTLPDGSIEVRTIVNTANTTNSIRVSSDFTTAPSGIWILAEVVTLTSGSTTMEGIALDTWRVVSITETDTAELEIVAIEHHPEKFLEIEKNLNFQVISTVPTVTNSLLKPTNLLITETLYLSAVATIGIKLHLSWTGTASAYKIVYKRNGGNWVELLSNTSNIDIYGDIVEDTYQFKIFGLNSLNMESPASDTLTYTVIGKAAPPTDIIYTTATVNSYGVELTWQPCLDVDFSYYEIREGTTWETATLVASNVTQPVYQVPFPSVGAHNYLVKAVDTSGNYSSNA